MATKSYTSKGLARRSRKLMLAGAVGLATVVFLVGLRAGVPQRPSRAGATNSVLAAAQLAHDAIPSLTYTEVGGYALRPALDTLPWAQRIRGLTLPRHKPVTAMDARLASLARRSERRAFNGAPPNIPHPIGPMTANGCMACHGQGVAFGDRVARAMPHPFYSSCTQCHVEEMPAALVGASAPVPETSWVGAAAPREGPRAWPGAPPAVPHAIQMRTACTACHGEYGWPGMQTSHPERTNCLQCHALAVVYGPDDVRVGVPVPQVPLLGGNR